MPDNNPDDVRDIVEEGIEYIVNGMTHELKPILRLIECVKEGRWEEAREIHENINRYRVFDDGLYHLPKEPLQELVESFLESVETDLEEHQDEKDPEPDPDAKPQCQLIGKDTNIFNLMGIAKKALEGIGKKLEGEEMVKRITEGGAHSFDEALAIIQEYVDVR